MTTIYIHSCRYVCDWCRTHEVGWSDVVPAGWRAYLSNQQPAVLAHACPACDQQILARKAADPNDDTLPTVPPGAN